MLIGKIVRGSVGRWGPVVLWMAFIFLLSDQPKPPFTWLVARVDWGDKIAHAMIYAVLGVLLWRALRNTYLRWTVIVVVAAAAIIYGLTDEMHQLFVPGRSFDLLDLAADAVGAAFAAAVLAVTMGGDANVGRKRKGEDLRSQGQAQSEP